MAFTRIRQRIIRKIKTFSKLFLAAIILVVSIWVMLLCKFISNPVLSLFKVKAKTEYLDVFTTESHNPRFILYNAFLTSEEDTIDINFSGSVSFQDSVKIRFKKSKSGSLFIELDRENRLGNTCTIHYPKRDSIVHIKEQLDIKISAGNNNLSVHKFPINGIATIGQLIDMPTYGTSNNILHSGTIATQVSTSSKESYKEVDTKDLYLGDAVSFKPIYNKRKSKKTLASKKALRSGVGLVSLANNEVMDVYYKIKTKEAFILKQGPKDINNLGYAIFSTSFDKIVNNVYVKNLSVLLGGLIVLFTIITFIYDTKLFIDADKN